MTGRHRGTYPYPTRPGLYSDIPGYRGGLLEIRPANSHRIAKPRVFQRISRAPQNRKPLRRNP